MVNEVARLYHHRTYKEQSKTGKWRKERRPEGQSALPLSYRSELLVRFELTTTRLESEVTLLYHHCLNIKKEASTRTRLSFGDEVTHPISTP